MTIAALFVATNGPYFGLEGVDPWDKHRDARLYPGPHRVVAHPPCERWGRYWSGGPNPNAKRQKLGDDGGCFESALASVRKWGGVLEHPAHSAAWEHFGLLAPPETGGWIRADWMDGHNGWTCHVEQGNYGHRARKATWLYAVSDELPILKWGPSAGVRIDEGFHSTDERARARAAGIAPIKRISQAERIHTPNLFRDLLLRIAAPAPSDYALASSSRESNAPKPQPPSEIYSFTSQKEI